MKDYDRDYDSDDIGDQYRRSQPAEEDVDDGFMNTSGIMTRVVLRSGDPRTK